jgi:hypothetical protein
MADGDANRRTFAGEVQLSAAARSNPAGHGTHPLSSLRTGIPLPLDRAAQTPQTKHGEFRAKLHTKAKAEPTFRFYPVVRQEPLGECPDGGAQAPESCRFGPNLPCSSINA